MAGDSPKVHADPGPLGKLTIGISISESPAPELAARGLGAMHLDHAFVELTRHLLAHGATIAYGGDHRVSGFARTLFDLVRTYDRADKPGPERIANFLAWPIHRMLPTAGRAALRDVATLIETALPDDVAGVPAVQNVSAAHPLPPDPAENRWIWARCLTEMRRRMNQQIDVRILLGGRYGGLVDGKLDRFLGRYPGLIEEAHLAITAGKPVFLIGGFGGCANLVADAVQRRPTDPLTLEFHERADPVYAEMVALHRTDPASPIDYQEVLHAFQIAGISGLNNGLDEQQNRRLFATDDLDEMIALVLEGLATR